MDSDLKIGKNNPSCTQSGWKKLKFFILLFLLLFFLSTDLAISKIFGRINTFTVGNTLTTTGTLAQCSLATIGAAVLDTFVENEVL
jgi:hypothetical protein